MTDQAISTHSKKALTIGIIGIVIALFGFISGIHANDARPIMSWIIGYSVWLSMGIGMLLITMLFWIFGAGWAVVVRRQLEHAISAFPFLTFCAVPLLVVAWFGDNPGILWKWMNPDTVLPGGETVANDVLYLKKEAFLNKPFFTIRILLYFSVFCYLSYEMRKISFTMDTVADTKLWGRARVLSAIGIPATAFSLTFLAFDFYMSLSYHWFSTMYGVWFFATSMRAGLAGAVVICALLSTRGYLKGVYNQGHRYLLGCLCLAFTIFWAYIAFSQYFLIYNANIPEETFWFNIRELAADGTKNSWWYVGLALVFGYFFLPFLYLLFYANKVKPGRILFICCWILAFHVLDLYFNILPKQILADNALGFTVKQFSIYLYDVAAFVGVGGICAWHFLKSMKTAQPVPMKDPFIKESVHFHE